MGCSACAARAGNVTPFSSVVYAPPTNNINTYNQSLEMIEALKAKLDCFLLRGIFPNTSESEVRIHLGYVQSMLNLQDIYRYNIQPYYNRIINESC